MITDLTNTLKRIYLLDYELPVFTYNDTNIVFTLNCYNFSGSSLMFLMMIVPGTNLANHTDNSYITSLTATPQLRDHILFPEMHVMIACACTGTHASEFTCGIYRTREVIVFSL